MKKILLIITLLLLTGCTPTHQLAVIDSIDRVNQCALLELEGSTFYNVLLKDIPGQVKEGDVIIITKNGFYVDSKDTEVRRKKITKLLNKLYKVD